MQSRRRQNNKWRAAAAFLCVLIAAALLCCIYFAAFPKRFTKEVCRYAEEYGVEEELLFAVIRAESNFRANAVSRAGAIGLMQLMPSTADFAASVLGVQDRDLFDPKDNVMLGAWYLHYLSERFTRLEEILAAYNAGEGTVRQWLRDPALVDGEGALIRIPYAETRRYVDKVKNFYFCYKFFYR